ncbi:MAG TPA: hypothetical protein VJU59_20900, partial [Paraburkholderia sp.]|uniref:hypothetical protein n=1 Tax=Paraburkholderia sp. TaxID=1926495 RepID=UPI002B482562
MKKREVPDAALANRGGRDAYMRRLALCEITQRAFDRPDRAKRIIGEADGENRRMQVAKTSDDVRALVGRA